MADIYISYAQADREFALRLSARLAQDYHHTITNAELMAGTISPGPQWTEQIERLLTFSDVCVVLMTPAALASTWVEQEVQHALTIGVHTIPVLLQHMELPPVLAQLNVVMAVGQSPEALATLLSEAVADVSRRQTERPAPGIVRRPPPQPPQYQQPASQPYPMSPPPSAPPAPSAPPPPPAEQSADEVNLPPLRDTGRADGYGAAVGGYDQDEDGTDTLAGGLGDATPRSPAPGGYPEPAPKQEGRQREEEQEKKTAKPEATASTQPLQFSAYHPNSLAVETWNTLLVYSYGADNLAQIQADAATFTELGNAPRTTQGQATRAVAHGTELTLEPHMEGVTFSPASDSFVWRGIWHRSMFRFSASAALANREQAGWIDVYAGNFIPIARIELAFPFFAARPQLTEQLPQGRMVTSNLHDTVFISYSHQDKEAFRQACEEYNRFGITIFTDEKLPAGADYEKDLAKMIQQARVFHLLWSSASAHSLECRKEWEAALQREPTERFIKPWYWHQPLTPPPPELAQYHISFRYQRLRRRWFLPQTWWS